MWSSVYFFTLASWHALLFAAGVLCLFMGLYYGIHLNFGIWGILKLSQHLWLTLVNLIRLLWLVMAFSETCTPENHVVTIISPGSLDIFTTKREVLTVYLLALPWGLLGLQDSGILVCIVYNSHGVILASWTTIWLLTSKTLLILNLLALMKIRHIL